ncbi:ferredoxin [Mangrovihabitans endophyticus]|uniref:Ferredoxin n=1 Tax=Mangrovihabitans endophyticus TaxID=1751298 RepID=A0A8J3C3I8_9ACTN|nr:ferredoxin [Mangrovihabitans endophyticus]GGL04158.1 ferredoxin [Mangrovihabitans endophyticus]
MKVSVDRDLCIGSGMCAMTAPAVFDQDPEEAVVVLRDENPPPVLHDAVREAVQRCPAAVIRADD